jgi:hypothetical protein
MPRKKHYGDCCFFPGEAVGIYVAVFSAIGTTCSFYYVKVDIGDAEFTDIMFIDGCFLLQYMCTNHQDAAGESASLAGCRHPNEVHLCACRGVH